MPFASFDGNLLITFKVTLKTLAYFLVDMVYKLFNILSYVRILCIICTKWVMRSLVFFVS